MIQMPQTTTPMNRFASGDSIDAAEENPAAVAEQYEDANLPSGDPLARFGAPGDLHAGVRQFAYASPGGGGGSGGNATQASAPPAGPNASKDAAKEAQAYMDAGIRLLKEGRYNEALETFQEGFRIYPDRGFILNEASTLFSAGRYAEAVLEYERYLSDPEAPRADEARDALERARAKLGGREVTDSRVAESRRLLEKGQQAFAAGRYEEALDAFQNAYELNPLAALKYNEASCLEKLGRLYAAADSYLAYASADPKAHDALDALARVDKLRAQADARPITATGAAGGQEWITRGNRLLMAGRADEAAAAYQEGFRTYPDRAFILNEAGALLQGGRFAEAEQKYALYLSDPEAPRADEARAAQERARAGMNREEAGHLYQQGVQALEAGRYQEALDTLDEAHDLSPLPEIASKQAAALAALGRPYAAVQRYEAYLKEKPDAKDAAEIKGRIAALLRDADAKPITANGEAGGREWILRGNRLLTANRYDDAVAAFQEGFRTYPDPAFILNEASALLDGGRYAEADRAYGRYLADPQAPRADEARAAQQRAREHMNTAEASRVFEQAEKDYKAGRYEKALAGFERAYELKPLAEITYNEAACLQKLGLPYAAAQRYQPYLIARPAAADAAKTRAGIDRLLSQADAAPITATGEAGGREWILRGNRLLTANRYDEAVKAYEEGFRTYPDPAFILNKASALLDGGRYAEADLAYQTYLSDPDAPRADEARAAQERARAHMGGREATITGVAESGRLFEKATELYKAGRYGEALEAFDRAYALNPLAQIRYNQAACLDMLGKRELAAQRYEAYLKEAPGAADAGKVQTRIGKLRNDALTAAHEAFDRGLAAFNAGRFKDAASEFAKAYEQKPLPEFLFNRAAALEKSGDTARAIQTFQLYLSMAPNAADADKVRAHIQKLQEASSNGLMRAE